MSQLWLWERRELLRLLLLLLLQLRPVLQMACIQPMYRRDSSSLRSAASRGEEGEREGAACCPNQACSTAKHTQVESVERRCQRGHHAASSLAGPLAEADLGVANWSETSSAR